MGGYWGVTAVKTAVPSLKDYLMWSQVTCQSLLTHCQDSAGCPGMLLLTIEEWKIQFNRQVCVLCRANPQIWRITKIGSIHANYYKPVTSHVDLCKAAVETGIAKAFITLTCPCWSSPSSWTAAVYYLVQRSKQEPMAAPSNVPS